MPTFTRLYALGDTAQPPYSQTIVDSSAWQDDRVGQVWGTSAMDWCSLSVKHYPRKEVVKRPKCPGTVHACTYSPIITSAMPQNENQTILSPWNLSKFEGYFLGCFQSSL